MISFWEKESFLNNDLLIIGGGLMGLSLASSVLERYPHKKVVIFERGILPLGASSKNAGMCCCGEITDFIDDIKTKGTQKAIRIFLDRYNGLNLLLSRAGREVSEYKNQGSYKIITTDEKAISHEEIATCNEILYPYFNKNVFVDRSEMIEEFGFSRKSVK